MNRVIDTVYSPKNITTVQQDNLLDNNSSYNKKLSAEKKSQANSKVLSVKQPRSTIKVLKRAELVQLCDFGLTKKQTLCHVCKKELNNRSVTKTCMTCNNIVHMQCCEKYLICNSILECNCDWWDRIHCFTVI